MQKMTAATIGFLCFAASWASSQTIKNAESVKADSGLRFLESGTDRTGVKEPSVVLGAAAMPHNPELYMSQNSLRKAESARVPVPPKLSKPTSFWRSERFAGAAAGVTLAVIIAGPAIGSGIPLLTAAGIVIGAVALGALIGYGVGTAVEYVATHR